MDPFFLLNVWPRYKICRFLPEGRHTVKKELRHSRPPPGCQIQKSPWADKLFPPRVSLVSDIPAEDGNVANLFYGAGVLARASVPPYIASFSLFPSSALSRKRLATSIVFRLDQKWAKLTVYCSPLPQHADRFSCGAQQYSGSVTFWSGSGSADPCLSLMDPDSDPDPAILSLAFKMPTKN